MNNNPPSSTNFQSSNFDNNFVSSQPPTTSNRPQNIISSTPEPSKSLKKNRKLPKIIILAIIITLTTIISLNFQDIKDTIIASTISLPEEITNIGTELNLTPYGKKIFYASSPSIEGFSEIKNTCQKDKLGDASISLFGCYTNSKIYIYSISQDVLPGAIESTSAHELLHAVWARLDNSERRNLSSTLLSVFNESEPAFQKDINAIYSEDDKIEEIYTRAATQLETLPDILEAHYSRVFTNRTDVVKHYKSYAKIFDSIEQKLTKLSDELTTLQTDINTKTTEYESDFASLESEIQSFNNCANTIGCFANSSFNAKRNELISKQNTINQNFNNLNQLIDQYNQKVEEYNKAIEENRELTAIINPDYNPSIINQTESQNTSIK